MALLFRSFSESVVKETNKLQAATVKSEPMTLSNAKLTNRISQAKHN
jgi:hypothetical protein